MTSKFCFRNKRFLAGGWGAPYGIVMITILLFLTHPAMAIDFALGGKPGRIMGYVNQGVQVGLAGDEFDTKSGFQSALFQVLVETEFDMSPDFRLFGSVGCNADWAYPILSSDSEWEDKDFDDSYDNLFIYSHRRDILREFHFTWTPGNWYFRVGKQIVKWGETDNIRIMDQVNPADTRRGITDVEFETTILPIWLVRIEYFLQPDSSWLQDLGFEFIFNPNADFRGDVGITLGNDVAGIWAPNIELRPGAAIGGLPYPYDVIHLGSMIAAIDEPSNFSDEGFEYAFRIKSVMWDTIVTLNYFYGRDNNPVTGAGTALPGIERSADDGRFILHPPMAGYYPLIRFAGFTLTRDFPNLYLSALGGVAPVLRLEAFYAFDNTFATAAGPFREYDEIRWAIGIDWKVWIRSINPRAAFMISPQFFHRKIEDAPSTGLTSTTGAVRDDNYTATLMINTTYFHNKIAPMVVWQRDISEKANMFILQVGYERSDVWNYTLGVLLVNGEKNQAGMEPLTNKDHVFFTVAYRFS